MSQPNSGQNASEHKRLKVFLFCLEQYVDDVKQEAEQKQIVFYWDTWDVRRAILGMADFYSPTSGAFRPREFQQRSSLVSCLGAEGLLGKMKLLRPHLAELGSWLGDEDGLKKNWPKSAQHFWHDADLPDPGDFRISEFAELSKDARMLCLRRYALHAESLFKFLGYSYPTLKHIHIRLFHLYNNYLDLGREDDETDLEEIMLDREYLRYAGYLDSKRPGFNKKLPNISDAVALCMLERKVAKFNHGDTNLLPRFYCSSNILRDAVADAKREDSFCCKAWHGGMLSVLRDEDYYYFRVAHAKRESSSSEPTKGPGTALGALEEIWERLKTARLIPSEGHVKDSELQEISGSIDVNGRPLQDIVQDYDIFSFLQNVCTQRDALRRLAAITSRFHDTLVDEKDGDAGPYWYDSEVVEGADDNIFDAAVEQRVKEARIEARSAFDAYGDIVHFMRDLEGEVERYQDRFTNASGDFDAFIFHGLNRFGIPSEYRPAISTALQRQQGGILGDSQNGTEGVFRAWLNTRNGRGREQELAVLMACLWSFNRPNLHQANLEIYDKLVVAPFWAVAIAGSSAINVNAVEAATQLVQTLEELLKDFAGRPQEDDTLVALSYLKFRLWSRTRKLAQFSGTGVLLSWKTERGRLINEAITHAKAAASLRHVDQLNGIYATNLWIYFVSEFSVYFPDEAQSLFEELRTAKVVSSFRSIKSEPESWQYRFDDTLARYYLQRFRIESNTDWLHLAERHHEDASKGCFDDEDVRDFAERLATAKDDWSRR